MQNKKLDPGPSTKRSNEMSEKSQPSSRTLSSQAHKMIQGLSPSSTLTSDLVNHRSFEWLHMLCYQFGFASEEGNPDKHP